jgi:mutator protein MutT
MAHSSKTLTLVFLRDGNNILLAMKKRGFGAGNWNGVGGKLEPGETIEQAMIRECQEEIGVTPTSYVKVAELTFAFPAGLNLPDMIAHTFIATQWQGQPTETDEMAPRWYNIAAIPYDQMWDDDILWLPTVLHGKKLRGRFDFTADSRVQSANLTIVQRF